MERNLVSFQMSVPSEYLLIKRTLVAYQNSQYGKTRYEFNFYSIVNDFLYHLQNIQLGHLQMFGENNLYMVQNTPQFAQRAYMETLGTLEGKMCNEIVMDESVGQFILQNMSILLLFIANQLMANYQHIISNQQDGYQDLMPFNMTLQSISQDDFIMTFVENNPGMDFYTDFNFSNQGNFIKHY